MTRPTRPTSPTRRQFLRHSADLALLTGLAGVLATSRAAANPAADSGMKSIQKMEGKVFVNGRAATADTYISPNAEVRTGPRSKVAFTAGGDLHMLKSNASVKLSGENEFVSNVRLLSGTLMSVWGTRPEGKETQLQTATATMGIRGTTTVAEPNKFTLLEGKVVYEFTDANGNRQSVNMESDGRTLRTVDANGRVINTPPDISAADIAFVKQALAIVAAAQQNYGFDPGAVTVILDNAQNVLEVNFGSEASGEAESLQQEQIRQQIINTGGGGGQS